jgi:putative ABC transport system permease protein
VLCGSGVIAALFLAWPTVAVLGRYAGRFSVRADGLKLDSNLVWFGIALALLAAVFLAYIPRLPEGNAPLSAGLTSGGTRVTSGSHRLRVFAVLQITASFLLLTGAAVLMRTLYTLEQTRTPVDAAHVLAVNLPVMTYGRTPQQVHDFYRDVQRRVSALPGVVHASTGFSVPWRDEQGLGISFTFAAQGAAAKNGIDWRAKFRTVSPGYFETLGLPVVAGRDFRDTDKDGAERVVIISQSLANTLFPGENPLNRELRWTDGVMKFIGISFDPRRIVGVVPDLDDENIIPNPSMMVYQPTDQEGWAGRTLQDIRAEVLTPDRLNAVVFGGFAAVALLISVVGVAGVLAFSVSGRTREFGIRMALGAEPKNILTDVLLQGLTIAGIGVSAGIVCGIVFAAAIGRYVAEVHLPGLLSFSVSAFIILAAAVIASAVPAARAASVNAVEALRSE